MRIIKIFFAAFIFSLPVIKVYSQQKGFSTGITAGIGIRDFYGGTSQENEFTNPTLATSAGISGQYNFNRVFALRLDISYILKGTVSKEILFTDNTGSEIGTGKVKTNLHYITIPLVFRGSIGNEKTRFIYDIGFFASSLLSARLKITNFDMEIEKEDLKENYRSMDGGTVLGIGVTHTIKEMLHLSLSARNYLSLVRLNKDNGAIAEGGQMTINTMLVLGISHSLGASKKK
jgi:hypothetical protein